MRGLGEGELQPGSPPLGAPQILVTGKYVKKYERGF
jgi:hypothetical protein